MSQLGINTHPHQQPIQNQPEQNGPVNAPEAHIPADLGNAHAGQPQPPRVREQAQPHMRLNGMSIPPLTWNSDKRLENS